MKVKISYANVRSLNNYIKEHWDLFPLFTSVGIGAVAAAVFPVWTFLRKQDLCVQRLEEVPYYERMNPKDHIRLYTNMRNVEAPSQTLKAQLKMEPYKFVSRKDEPRAKHE